MVLPAGRGKCLRNPMPRGEHRLLRRDGPREISSEGSWPIVVPDLRLSEATTEARLGGGSSRQRSRVATVPAAPVPSRGGRTAHRMQWRPTSPRKHREACCLDGQAPVLVVLWSCGLLPLVSLPRALPSRSLRRRKDGARREEEEGDEAQTGGAEGGKPRGAVLQKVRKARDDQAAGVREEHNCGVPQETRRAAHKAFGRKEVQQRKKSSRTTM